MKVGAAKGRSDNPIFSNETIIPTDGHPIGNNIRLLAESSSGKGIRSITVKAYDPQANSGQGGFTEAAVKNKLGLTTSGLKGSGSKRWVDLTGDIPSNRFGINNIVVEAEDSSGHKETTTVRVTRPLPQASFITKTEELNGAANKTGNERPIVSGKIPFPIETNNIPNDADLKAYLVTGGRVDNDRYIPGASDYTTIAVTRVKADGTFTFDPSTYNKNTIGTNELRLVVKYARKGTNDTYYEGLESLFSADSRRATEPEVNKQALQDLVNGAEAKRKTHDYYNAEPGKKTAYDDAITKADAVLKKAGVTQAEINAEKTKVETALQGLQGAETNKSELQTLVDEATNTVLSYKYHNADKDKKDTFDKAIEKAKAVLADLYASQKAVDDVRDNLKLAKESLNGIYIPPHTPQADQPQPSTPTKPDQGGTETPTSPSEPAPQPSQPAAPGQPASSAPAPSSAPTQAPRVAASPSASSTSTQAPAQEQVDKSELRALTQELDQRLKALVTVSDPKIDAAKAVLLDAQKALEDSALTEQGLRTAVESVKAALDSLKDVKANASDSKPAQDKKDTKQGTEDSKDSDKMTETNSVPAGVIVVGLLALLGVIAFWLVRRKKESEIQQLSTELTRVLGQLDAEKADKKVLAKAQNLLQETLDFVKEENGSAETEAKLVEELKAILAKLK